jgi:hypothetical protein
MRLGKFLRSEKSVLRRQSIVIYAP